MKKHTLPTYLILLQTKNKNETFNINKDLLKQ